jgi:hypothetical protein
MATAEDIEVIKEEYLLKARFAPQKDIIKTHIPAGSSVLDLGCGDKDMLNYITCSDYHGVDVCELADQVHDFDGDLLTWDRTWDVGLMVSMLYYPEDTDRFLNHYKQFASKWIVTIAPMPRLLKPEWNHSFSPTRIEGVLNTHFTTISSKIEIESDISRLGREGTKYWCMYICTP